MKLQFENCKAGTPRCGVRTAQRAVPTFRLRSGFTLIEVMVAMAILTLIVIALMGVFNNTQAAFRASVTQTDVLEGGRAAMDLISSDLREMAPSGVPNQLTIAATITINGPVNFFVGVSTANSLIQPLIASSASITNVLEEFFLLTRENQTWTGVGYLVDTTSTNYINPLYRFSMSTNVSVANGPGILFSNFTNLKFSQSPPWSHLLNGVLTLRVRAYDPNGIWLTNGYVLPQVPSFKGAAYFPAGFGETGIDMFSNTLPATVEVELATLEDRTLQRAGTWPNNSVAQSNFLAQQAGKVHVFRQRVQIPNYDPSAYQP